MIKIENTKTEKIVKIINGLIVRITLLVLIIIWPYLFNYNYHFIWVWMSNAIFTWEIIVVISCILSIITKMRYLQLDLLSPNKEKENGRL